MKRVAAIFLASWSAVVSAAQIDFNFSNDEVGKPPPNFASLVTGAGRPADWKIIEEAVPPVLAPLSPEAASHIAKREVLSVQSLSVTANHFPILLFTNEIFDDFTLSTRFKIGGGVVEPSAGVIFRAQDENNYYVVRASTEGNLLWYRVVNGQQYDTLGIGIKTPIEKNVWRELRVECQGNHIRCFLDGKLAIPPAKPGAPTNDLAIVDTTFARGKVGFWTKADSECYFVDGRVEYHPKIPYAQIVVNNVAKQHPAVIGLQIYAGKEGAKPDLIASIHEQDIGAPGTAAETDVIAHATVYYLKLSHAVEVTVPLRDRNGDVAAAMKVKMKSFPGETQDTAISRATQIKLEIEGQIGTLQDIREK